MSPSLRSFWKPLLIVIVLVLLGFAARSVDLPQLLRWFGEQKSLGGWLFAAVYALGCIVFLPGFILTLAAGPLFGLGMGVVWVSLGSTVGACLAFLIGRYGAREWVSKKIENNKTFQALDQAVGDDGWKIVGLTRLSPIFPFNLLNYAFGVTRVRFRDYVWASWLGMLPGTILYVYVGSLAGEVTRLSTSGRTRTSAEWALYGVGLVATIAVSILVARRAKAALTQRGLDSKGSSS